MKLHIAQSVDTSEWDERVRLAGGTIFHSSIWAKYVVAEHPNSIPQFFTLESNDGEFLGVALGFQIESKNKFVAFLTRSLWFEAMPVVCSNDEGTLREFIRLIEKHAYSSGNVTLSLGSYASQDRSAQLHNLGFGLTERMEFEISLCCSEEDIWKKMKKKSYEIRKAVKMGVTVDELPVERGIIDFRRLQVETDERISKRGGYIAKRTRAYEEDPLQLLLESGFAKIMGASVEGRIVSTSILTHFNDLVYTMHGAHEEKAFENEAPILLIWESIRRYRNEGAKRYNLGGCQAGAVHENSNEHGVYIFKSRLGASCLRCVNGEKVIRKINNNMAKLGKSILVR